MFVIFIDKGLFHYYTKSNTYYVLILAVLVIVNFKIPRSWIHLRYIYVEIIRVQQMAMVSKGNGNP